MFLKGFSQRYNAKSAKVLAKPGNLHCLFKIEPVRLSIARVKNVQATASVNMDPNMAFAEIETKVW